jgi:hypothetical protein
MNLSFRLLVLLALPLSCSIACDGMVGGPIADDDFFDEDSADDTGMPNDDDTSPGGGESDDNMEQCGVPATVDDLGMRSGEAYKESEDGNEVYELAVVVDAGPPDDVLYVGLFEGYGAFKNQAPGPGTYTIAGEDASAIDCGACVVLDINATEDSAERSLMAVGGQLTITSVNGTFSGSAQNLVLQELDLESGEVLPDGCTTSIGNVSFSAPLQ